MKYDIPSFYSNFYGKQFARLFVRVPPMGHNQKVRMQFNALDPQQLYNLVHENSGYFKCFISTYSYGTSIEHLNGYKSHPLVDRVFFDFDLESPDIKNALNELNTIRKNGLHYMPNQQEELLNYIHDCIVNRKVSIEPINQAKEFAEFINCEYGAYPILFFSGFKGCHVYAFFKQINLNYINNTIQHFAEGIKERMNLDTMDLSVNKDPNVRKSRIPYSKNEMTGLTVVPFQIDDSYDEIIDKALNPTVEPFNTSDYLTSLNNHLKELDRTIPFNQPVKHQRRSHKTGNNRRWVPVGSGIDNRQFFREYIGPPEREYTNYDAYNCPFPDHQDNNPSFVVYDSGYKCYGCDRKGNYWQFLKDRRNMSDSQIRKYLELKFKNFIYS